MIGTYERLFLYGEKDNNKRRKMTLSSVSGGIHLSCLVWKMVLTSLVAFVKHFSRFSKSGSNGGTSSLPKSRKTSKNVENRQSQPTMETIFFGPPQNVRYFGNATAKERLLTQSYTKL